MNFRALRPALVLALLVPAATALAQREGYSYLSYVGPEVSLVSTAEDDSGARLNTPVLAGDRLSTGPSSRAEAVLADGNVVRVDVQTELRFDRLAQTYESDDDRNVLYLERGALSLEHRLSTSSEEATRIDTDDATILFPDRGLLRVETGRKGTEIYVLSGRAEVNARSGRAVLRAGEYAYVSGDDEIEVDRTGEPRDGFTRFVSERRSLGSGRSGSQYVSADYDYDYAVGDFDRYGSWVDVGGSSCWRPSVSADWRPYEEGYWRWSPAGLTWVSYEPWGWLPYHYGSWLWDAGFGWCWSPGSYYSPAWVYWSYTPSWVGWCPIGYYGGYWDSWQRSHRYRSGAERWTHAYPHLRGRVDVTRIDPRGWSYASVNRLGSRFDARRDVLGRDAVRFRPGERGVVVTTPLRIDRGRGSSVTTAVRDAVRRVPQTFGAETRGDRGGVDLTPIFRRDGTLGTTERDQLRRSFVTTGRDPAYRPVAADQLAAPRRDGGGTLAGAPVRGGDRGFDATTSPTRGADGRTPVRGSGARETWRDTGTAGDARGTRGADALPRRDAGSSLGGGFGRDRGVKGDDGWRSPGTRTPSTPSRTFDVPSRRDAPAAGRNESPARAGRRETAPESEPWRSTVQPPARHEPSPDPSTGSSGRRAVPPSRRDEGWRGGDPPARSYDAPRSAPAPRSDPPPSRSYEAPRSAPAPRSDAPPARSYDAPSRSYDAPRSAPRYDPPPARSYSAPSRSYEAPRSAPAPRSEAPSRSYSAPSRSSGGSSSHSSPPPSSGSSDAPRRGGSPRG